MKKIIQQLAALATALSTMSVSAGADGQMTDQIIVKIRAGAASASPQTERWSAVTGEALGYAREFGADGYILKLRGFVPLARAQAIAARLAADSDIEYAEADQIMQPTAVPNDAEYVNQWGYFAPQAGLMGANLPGAWDATTGSANLTIAVIDTGILPHAELVGRYVGGYDFIGTRSIANDGNARDSDPSDPGDWVAADECYAGSLASNSSWHGTHVAGTIAAASNNGSAVAGVNWVSQVVPVRVLGKCGGYTSDIVDGMRWAAGLSVRRVPANPYPAKVMNLSLGGFGLCTASYQNAINEINAKGAVVVVSAGNNGTDARDFSPASCAGVVTVAATGKAGNKSYYSNYGSAVEIAAPGGDKNADAGQTILSTLNAGTTTPGTDSLAYYQGTSMAAPHVTGVVSLMLSVAPSLTPPQVTHILQLSATPFPIGSTCNSAIQSCGAGIVNAASAVALALNPPPPPPPSAFSKTSPTNGATKRPTALTLSWGQSIGATSYEYCVSATTSCSTWTSVGPATSASPSALAPKTRYYWQARAINISGNVEANNAMWWGFTTR